MPSNECNEIQNFQLRKLCGDIIAELRRWPYVEIEKWKLFEKFECWFTGYVSGFNKGREKRKFVAIGTRDPGLAIEINSLPIPVYKKIKTKQDWNEVKKIVKSRYTDLVAKM